jgi:hypothetical protein
VVATGRIRVARGEINRPSVEVKNNFPIPSSPTGGGFGLVASFGYEAVIKN